MTVCCQQTFGFQALGSRRVKADFSGGHLSGDGGVLPLREADRHPSLRDKPARCFSGTRDERFVEHSLPGETRRHQRDRGKALAAKAPSTASNSDRTPNPAANTAKSKPPRTPSAISCRMKASRPSRVIVPGFNATDDPRGVIRL